MSNWLLTVDSKVKPKPFYEYPFGRIAEALYLVMLTRILRVAAVVGILAIPFVAVADSKAVAAAKDAVRRAVRNKVGAAQRVTFVEAKEKFLSLGEVVVDGNGYLSESAGWKVARTFTFTVKVKRDGSQTRDIRLTLGDGHDVVDQPGWENATTEGYVTLTEPRWYQRLNNNNVLFEGESKGDVVISVFDQNNKKVVEGKAKPSGGRFRAVLYVPRGMFRAVIQPVLSFDWDEVRFSVMSNGNDWGLPGNKPTPGVENLIYVDQPGANSTVEGPRVTISGTSSERDVKVEVFDGRNKRILNSTIAVRNNRWSTSVNLEDGNYRILAQTWSGKDKDQRNFRVVSRGNPGGGVENIVDITAPKDGARVSPLVTIAGKSSEDWVNVQIFDPTNKLVTNRRVSVRNGEWSVQVTLNGGSHRLVVESASGRDSDARRFTVDPRLRNGG